MIIRLLQKHMLYIVLMCLINKLRNFQFDAWKFNTFKLLNQDKLCRSRVHCCALKPSISNFCSNYAVRSTTLQLTNIFWIYIRLFFGVQISIMHSRHDVGESQDRNKLLNYSPSNSFKWCNSKCYRVNYSLFNFRY